MAPPGAALGQALEVLARLLHRRRDEFRGDLERDVDGGDPLLLDDSMSSASNRVFAAMIQIDAIAGVPGLRWKVSLAFAPYVSTVHATREPRRV